MKLFTVLALFFADIMASAVPEGGISNPGQFPFIAQLLLEHAPAGNSSCGGVLIRSDFILTAAHCLDGVSSGTIYLGSIERNTGETVISVDSSAFTIHKKYNAKTLDNDIAMIRVPTVAFNDNIKPRRVSMSQGSLIGSDVYALGWGNNADDATTLQWTRLVIQPSTACGITSFGQACVKVPSGICNGIAGEPIIASFAGQLLFLNSFGLGTGCEGDRLVVYTNLRNYANWIRLVQTEADKPVSST